METLRKKLYEIKQENNCERNQKMVNCCEVITSKKCQYIEGDEKATICMIMVQFFDIHSNEEIYELEDMKQYMKQFDSSFSSKDIIRHIGKKIIREQKNTVKIWKPRLLDCRNSKIMSEAEAIQNHNEMVELESIVNNDVLSLEIMERNFKICYKLIKYAEKYDIL
jgi:hypothetical protein